MKVPNHNLFDLIHSMSAAEKRYFRRHYASEKNLTTFLFDFINRQESYDEHKVHDHFRKTKLSKNLKVYKVQLGDILLKSLVSYHYKKSVKSKIRQGLEELDILIDKQLYGLARTRVQKLRKLAEDSSIPEYQLLVIQTDLYIQTVFADQFSRSKIPQLESASEVIQSLRDLNILRRLNYEISDLYNAHNVGESKQAYINRARDLMKHALFSKKHTEPFHQFYSNGSKAIYHKLVETDPEKEYEYKKANVDLFIHNPNLIQHSPGTYFAAFYNYLVCCRAQGRKKELHEGLTKIKDLFKTYPALRRHRLYIYYLETKEAFLRKDYAFIITNLQEQAVTHIKKHKQQKDNITALMYTYFILSHLARKDYSKVHRDLRFVFNERKSWKKNYLRMFDLLEVISHVESADYQMALTLIKSHQKRMKNHKGSDLGFFDHLMAGLYKFIRAEEDQKSKILEEVISNWSPFAQDGLYMLSSEFFLEDWKTALQKNISLSKQLS
ncbi:MAG: hypothetical protein HKN16_11175 [Saprospiraceae bacterium]|nr:hypothetical protein [Saprospiraceae bacterium]